jgi:hypothetical protein
MKILPFILLLILVPVFGFSSTNGPEPQGTVVKESHGVKFEQMSFTGTLAKALKENKLLMVDNYTDT